MSDPDKKNRLRTLLKPSNFGLIIGLLVFLIITLIANVTNVFGQLETNALDWHFKIKNLKQQKILQTGVSIEERNLRVSPDIIIIGIDSSTLDLFGRWPFSRSIHASFLDSLSRIQRQNEREASVFLDVFFINPDENAYNDVKLINSMQDNNRVFLETVLDINPPSYTMPDMFDRQQALYDQSGLITNVQGDFRNLFVYHSAEPPLIPYAKNVAGYGHANFKEDEDKKYRRQQMIARLTEELTVLRFEELKPGFTVNVENFERLAWQDEQGNWHDVDMPLTEKILDDLAGELESNAPQTAEDLDGDGEPDNYYYQLTQYRDTFIPSITLALAADYFHINLSDIKVVLGSHILLDNPRIFDPDSQEIVPYRIMTKAPVLDDEGNLVEEAKYRNIPEIRIPINEGGEMLINFMGPRSNSGRGGFQTFPVRSYSAYTRRIPPENPESWPRTKALGNKILMVGGFFQGTDEKTTPWGLMYGVEIHANALNTILMDNFIIPAPEWSEWIILFIVILFVAFYTSRINTGWSFLITLLFLGGYFLVGDIVFFEQRNIMLHYATPAMGAILAFVSVVIYRVVMEESDKRMLKDMFGKYVNPLVVEQMMMSPPVLGGTDMDVTVFFSDIRSFTTLSESMEPQELVALLNQYLTSMTDCMMDYTGTLDKYIGDAIMGFWGAPLAQEEHAQMACKSALKQLELLSSLNETLPEHKRIRIGIGLNSGICTVGNMGSQGRMNYTCMGDNVNLASRLEAINKQYRTELVISEYTYRKIEGDPRFICRELDDIRVKGKRKPVRIYELVGYDGSLDL